MRYVLVFATAALAIAGCARNEGEQAAPEPPAEATAPEASSAEVSRTAMLAPTQGNQASGSLTLTAHDGGVMITGQITGLEPNSEHGFHVHENGDCSAPDASSAGSHFNPTNQPHGDPSGDAHHAGDAPNIRADAQGTAEVNIHMEGVTLGDGGPNDIAGRAIVVHEKADDYTTQPSGDSGARIACGVIG